MTRKALWLLPASVAAVAASQWRDIARYIKIRQMSRGGPDRNTDSGAPPSTPLFRSAEQGAVGVERGLAAQMRVQHGRVRADPARPDQVDEPGH
jgi:hypothetical protein